MRTALFWAIMLLVVVIPYRRFGRTYRSNIQGSRILKMGPIVCPETSVRNYHCSLRNSPGELSSQPRNTSLTVPDVRLQMNWDLSKVKQQCYAPDCGFRISGLCSDFIFWGRKASGHVFEHTVTSIWWILSLVMVLRRLNMDNGNCCFASIWTIFHGMWLYFDCYLQS